MMRALMAAASSLALLGLLPDLAFGQYDQNTLCRIQKPGVSKFKKQVIPDGYDNVETYLLDSDFRSPSKKIPWSETKI